VHSRFDECPGLILTGQRRGDRRAIDLLGKPLSDDVKRAFLVGVKYGYRRAAKETRRDAEQLMDELHEANDEVHTLLAAIRSERPTHASETASAIPRHGAKAKLRSAIPRHR
jgi:hypothetical protein